MSYLLDTTVVVDYVRGYPPGLELVNWLFSVTGDLYTCDVVSCEALSRGDAEEQQAVRTFLDALEFVAVDPDAARWAGDRRRELLEREARQTTVGDALIAGLAWRLGATVVSRNAGDFEPLGVPALGYDRLLHRRPSATMRDVFDWLERMGIAWYITGSEALGQYGEPRQTMDVDVVVELGSVPFERLERAFEHEYLVAEPIDFGGHVMASLISRSELSKVDLIFSRADTWSRSAMARRRSGDHPRYGNVWFASLEDLILATLDWSEGTSELKLRDCRNLIGINRDRIDWEYLGRYADTMGTGGLLEQARRAP